MTQKVSSILDAYPLYEVVIGIEVHVQLKTQSKIFCSCPNQFGDTPNRNICPVCTGQPGTLPSLNRKAVDYAIMAGLATHSSIPRLSEFSRKHYTYPDLPKNYQITQGDRPVCLEGYIPVEKADGTIKKIRIQRIHLEEDAGKNLHGIGGESYVDLNRTGTPLIEIVTHPDIASAQEAKSYLQNLRTTVQYLGISEANMEEGSFRGDINISVKKKTAKEFGTKVELKNLNSLKFIGQAIEYEIGRQIEMVERGEKVKQETRLWDTKENKTVFMRSKEQAQDYRYFTDPDLPVLIIDDEWLKRMKEDLPELPFDRYTRFKKEYSLTPYEAEIVTGDRELADFFEEAAKKAKAPKQVCNWMLRDILGYMNEHKMSLSEIKVTADMLAELVIEIEKGVINSKIAQEVFAEMQESGKYPSIIIQEKDLTQIGSADELDAVVREVIASNPKVVADYKGGNERSFTFFVGMAMKATKGKANPQLLQELIKKHLDS